MPFQHTAEDSSKVIMEVRSSCHRVSASYPPKSTPTRLKVEDNGPDASATRRVDCTGSNKKCCGVDQKGVKYNGISVHRQKQIIIEYLTLAHHAFLEIKNASGAEDQQPSQRLGTRITALLLRITSCITRALPRVTRLLRKGHSAWLALDNRQTSI
ncbi:hypothetical protein R3P38DRAFT_2776789 [Favolaschia claudopus]|uniref:Uncharacterized protein n=1 Tax=Favolaschia claudopus TaxID=2862362 RepID=A0AAW0BP80_9AGAR